MTHRLVIITNGNYFARLILEGVLDRYTPQVKQILVITGDYKGRTGLRALWAVGRKTAAPYVAYKVLSVYAFALAQRLRPDAEFTVAQQAHRWGIPVAWLPAVNTDAARSLVGLAQPDLLISVSCPQLIGRKMLALARLGGINIHSSLLPAYAGLAPYFWVLSQGERTTGTTVHYMTQKFDEGNILAQRSLAIEPKESAFHLFRRLAVLGSDALMEAVDHALRGWSGDPQDMSRYSYFSHPKFSAYWALRRRGHVLMRPGELWEAVQAEVTRSRSHARQSGKVT